ncbi:hypothetical protein STTU_4533 [Streptomyces sp. Tu6071]|nr:hypothetical protein STTU_4533 [Streptomyces sp. Tu6071]
MRRMPGFGDILKRLAASAWQGNPGGGREREGRGITSAQHPGTGGPQNDA